jgi:RimJ/RimL family protein N-acetyltransferase
MRAWAPVSFMVSLSFLAENWNDPPAGRSWHVARGGGGVLGQDYEEGVRGHGLTSVAANAGVDNPVVVRDLTLADTEALIPAGTSTETDRFMDSYGPRTPDEVRAWVPEAISCIGEPRYGTWVIEVGGEVVGWIGFGGSSRGVGEVDFAYVICPAHRGRGYAGAALRHVVAHCFANGVQSVWGECHVGNDASAGVMLGAGLTEIGVVGTLRRFRIERS